MAIHFCTFGDAPYYTHTIRMLLSEAESSGYFNSIHCFNQHDLELDRKHLDYMARTRGFGYWSWKPLVVALTMLNSDENDIIVYADAGCGISTTTKAKDIFREWMETVQEHPTHRLVFQMNHREEEYTKADLFDELACPGDVFTKTGQYVAGVMTLMNTRKNREFVSAWMKWCIADHYRFVSDSPSRLPNPSTFKDHRHDQSLFSLLIKKHGAAVISDEWLNPDMPIIALRRRVRMNYLPKCRVMIYKAFRTFLRRRTCDPYLYEGPISPIYIRCLAGLAGS